LEKNKQKDKLAKKKADQNKPSQVFKTSKDKYKKEKNPLMMEGMCYNCIA